MVRISEIAFSSYEKAENEHNETLKKYRTDDTFTIFKLALSYFLLGLFT